MEEAIKTNRRTCQICLSSVEANEAHRVLVSEKFKVGSEASKPRSGWVVCRGERITACNCCLMLWSPKYLQTN